MDIFKIEKNFPKLMGNIWERFDSSDILDLSELPPNAKSFIEENIGKIKAIKTQREQKSLSSI